MATNFLPPAKHIPENDALPMTAKAAIFLGVSVALLQRDHWAGKQFGKGPLILYRHGRARAVRYRRRDLIAHLEKNLNTQSFAIEGPRFKQSALPCERPLHIAVSCYPDLGLGKDHASHREELCGEPSTGRISLSRGIRGHCRSWYYLTQFSLDDRPF
jgi:hypothetical protein